MVRRCATISSTAENAIYPSAAWSQTENITLGRREDTVTAIEFSIDAIGATPGEYVYSYAIGSCKHKNVTV